ncbi:MAG: flavin reductase family protein [Campylobacterota bacterium]|nr:flavin reductase family protein [Campylobacterota bacterium]
MIDMQSLDKKEIYKLMSTYIIPRPIAWIVTQNEEGVINVAPFSYFAPLSSTPPALVVSIGHKADGSPKDTLANIRKSKKATICMVTEELLEKMHYSSKPLDSSKSEADTFDIAMVEKVESFPPMVEGVNTAFFCEFNQEVVLEGSPTIPVILEIKHSYVDETPQNPISRVARTYAKIGEALEAPQIP